MANLSEHFNKENFSCRCQKCRNETVISLTLVGILEDLRQKLQTRVNVLHGYACADAEIDEPGPKKNYHGVGKAVDINVAEPEKLIEAFRYLETFPEISGLGFNPEKKYIHLDLREKTPVKWIYLKGAEEQLTPETREAEGLGTEPIKGTIPKAITLELPVDI